MMIKWIQKGMLRFKNKDGFVLWGQGEIMAEYVINMLNLLKLPITLNRISIDLASLVKIMPYFAYALFFRILT